MTDVHHDVVVVGDGPVGLVHAAAQAAAGRSVAVVGPGRRHPAGTFELLSGDLAPVLQVVGILPDVRTRAPRCAGTVFRWGNDAFTEQNGQQDRWAGGWVIDRSWFDQALRDVVAASFPQIEFLDGNATTVQRAAGVWAVEVAGPAQDRMAVAGRSLSLATGRSDRLHNGAGLPAVRRHPMVAITCRIPNGLPDLGPRLLVDAADNGWWYAMGDGRSSTVGYVTDADLLAAGPDRIRATWAAAIPSAPWVPGDLVDAPVVARRSVVGDCPPRAGDTAALPVGDAVLSEYPLSGHGLLVGLRGALHAAADLDGYLSWVGEQITVHREQERRLYEHVAGARPGHGEFWSRRCR
jgi:2-polyprenyl-6-methoxyphenol hydroxylase-like FAD-dependent oxidoreductase